MQIITQLVTPFYLGEVDYDVLEFSVDRQARYGTDGVLVCGKWGEKSTLVDVEHINVAKSAVRAGKGRIKIYASAGSNNTAKSESLTAELLDVGVDGVCLTLPYYNKGKECEIVKSAQKIGEKAKGKRVFLFYEEGKSLSKEGERELIKSGVEIVRADGEWKRGCYDGDRNILNALILNSTIFSVISNVFPSALLHLRDKWESGNIKSAINSYFDLADKIELIYNGDVPALKYALSLWGLSYPTVRSPLIECDEYEKAKIRMLFD